MLKNLSKILFMFMMFLGTIISISANSWMSVWIGLEINLLSFIPMMSNKNNLNNSEASLNYFLIQAFASTIILFSMIMKIMFTNSMFFFNYNFLMMYMIPMKMITLALMIKLGAAPFHFWFPNVMENINWFNSMLLLTWQKLAPMMILSYLILLNKMFMIFIISSTIIGAIGGLNTTSIRKLLAFSSINHMGWMFTAIMFNEYLWVIYFLIYSFLNFSIIFLFKIMQIFYLNQMYSMFMNSYFLKFNLLTSMLSLGGLPPFLGFAPKWLIIQSLIFMKMNMINILMIMMSLITLYYYLKISFSSFMLNYNEFNWNFKSFFKNKTFNYLLFFNFISLFSFFLVMDLIFLF